MKKSIFRFRAGDAWAVVSILLLAGLIGLLFLPNDTSNALCAQIYMDGELIRTVSLTTDQEFTVTSAYTNTVTVRNGAIAVTGSDCPGGDCLHCGWIHGTGKSIVCLPNGLEIRVVSQNNDVDFVVG